MWLCVSYPSVQSTPRGPLGWKGVCLRVYVCMYPSVQSVCFLFISPSHYFTQDNIMWVSVSTCVWLCVSACSHLSALYVQSSLYQIRPLKDAENCLCMYSSVHVFPLQFTEAGMFETVWQVKYYNYNKRDHCQWGNSFNSIEYECKPNDTRTLMWVNKEMFVWCRNSLTYLLCKNTRCDVSDCQYVILKLTFAISSFC